MSTSKHSGALMSMGQWNRECSWMLMGPWLNTHDRLWVILVPRLPAYEWSWVIKSAHDHSLVLMSALGSTEPKCWVFIGAHEHSWAFTHEQPLALMSMLPVISALKRSWALSHGAMSIDEHSRWHCPILMISAILSSLGALGPGPCRGAP